VVEWYEIYNYDSKCEYFLTIACIYRTYNVHDRKDAHLGHKMCVFITHNADVQLIHALVTEKFQMHYKSSKFSSVDEEM